MQSLKRVRKRQGRCYELAFKVMLDEPGAEQFKLVHGTVERDPMIGHAWILLPDSRVYDPVLDEYFTEREYAEKRSAVAEVSYTRKQAAAALVEANYSGPWHETLGLTFPITLLARARKEIADRFGRRLAASPPAARVPRVASRLPRRREA